MATDRRPPERAVPALSGHVAIPKVRQQGPASAVLTADCVRIQELADLLPGKGITVPPAEGTFRISSRNSSSWTTLSMIR